MGALLGAPTPDTPLQPAQLKRLELSFSGRHLHQTKTPASAGFFVGCFPFPGNSLSSISGNVKPDSRGLFAEILLHFIGDFIDLVGKADRFNGRLGGDA